METSIVVETCQLWCQYLRPGVKWRTQVSKVKRNPVSKIKCNFLCASSLDPHRTANTKKVFIQPFKFQELKLINRHLATSYIHYKSEWMGVYISKCSLWFHDNNVVKVVSSNFFRIFFNWNDTKIFGPHLWHNWVDSRFLNYLALKTWIYLLPVDFHGDFLAWIFKRFKSIVFLLVFNKVNRLLTLNFYDMILDGVWYIWYKSLAHIIYFVQ